MKLHIVRASETFVVNTKTGGFSRPKIGMSESNTWLCTGAVRLNNFGNVVQRVDLKGLIELVQTNPKALFHKNGKQRWYITDLDHGTRRIQMGPKLLTIVVK